MKKLRNILRNHYSSSDLETRVLTTSMLAGMFIAFLASFINPLIGLSWLTVLIPFCLWIAYIGFIYILIAKKNYKFSAYGSLLFLTFFIFPSLWFLNGGLSGSIPYFYIFMIFLSAVVLKNFAYKRIISLQLLMILVLFYVEFNFPEYVQGYATKEAHLIDLAYSLIFVIALVIFMTRYIMKEYHHTIEELKKLHQELEDTNKYLHHASITDELTKLYNRRYITDQLSMLLKKDSSEQFAVIMIDIDHFKKINDRFGHSTGDHVLRIISDRLKQHVPEKSHVARIGGEEFLIVLEQPADHQKLAEELRLLVETLEWDRPQLKTTISIGTYIVLAGDSMEDILHHVDTALYRAKDTGRNRVVSIKS